MKTRNIGIVSTRLSGTDGVSLESEKWAAVFERLGYRCHYLAGVLERPPDRSLRVEEAHFLHPAVREIYRQCFMDGTRTAETTRAIFEVKERLKNAIAEFVQTFDLGLLVAENALSIPLNLPLGIALTEYISETGMPTIAHHHDFFWERKRFLTNSAWEYLNMAFPPHLPSIQHVVINTSASNQLGLRTGISPTLIPNVMDFETPPPAPDDYASDVREVLGIDDDELFILQPTRVVQRKGIEHAIELARRLDRKARLVISHASGDEGYAYERRLREYSRLMNVDTLFISECINDVRGETPDGRKIYTLDDIYPHADLVTYPSTFEGFGNAFLEAVYHRKPILVNAYSIYSYDIKPKGFRCIEMDGFISEETLEQARHVLDDAEEREDMVEHNYRLARRAYSYAVLERKLTDLIEDGLQDASPDPV